MKPRAESTQKDVAESIGFACVGVHAEVGKCKQKASRSHRHFAMCVMGDLVFMISACERMALGQCHER